MHGDVGGGFMMLGMWLVWLVPLILVALATRLGVPAHRNDDTALDLLKARYARGEITREQFQHSKEDLG